MADEHVFNEHVSSLSRPVLEAMVEEMKLKNIHYKKLADFWKKKYQESMDKYDTDDEEHDNSSRHYRNIGF